MAIKSADQITIVDVTDAYSVMLTSEAYAFVGNTSGAPSGLTCTTQAVALCGTNQCSVVNVTAGDIVCPTGISATVSNSGSSSPTITFTTTATITSACEATIPVVVDGITVNKKFSFAVAKTGATGVTVDTSGWSTTPTATDTTNKYIWSYQKTTYTDNSTSKSTPAIIGTHGATGGTGDTGKGVSKIETYYLTTSASSGVTTSTSGWSTTPTATTTTNKYIWSYQKTTYTDGTTSSSTPAIVGTHGATGAKGDTGAAGADAITLSITTSNGTVFKNNTESTVLTAHVFKGGVEQSITDAGVCGSLGTIKWYKGGSTTAVATAKTLNVSASDVTNSVAYTCQLEA